MKRKILFGLLTVTLFVAGFSLASFPALAELRTITITLQSSPGGLQLVLNGRSAKAPFATSVIQGSRNTISAPTPQTVNRTSYTFLSWSDGGAQTHDVVPPASVTYAAKYRR